MGDESTPSEKGYGAGKQGASAEANPYSTGIGGRILGAMISASTGTLLDPIAEQDAAAKEWEDARQAGQNDAKDDKSSVEGTVRQ
jgi:hypothetical protein